MITFLEFLVWLVWNSLAAVLATCCVVFAAYCFGKGEVTNSLLLASAAFLIIESRNK